MLARTLATRHKRLPLRARAAQNVEAPPQALVYVYVDVCVISAGLFNRTRMRSCTSDLRLCIFACLHVCISALLHVGASVVFSLVLQRNYAILHSCCLYDTVCLSD